MSAESFLNTEITAIGGKKVVFFGAVCVTSKTKRIVPLPGEL